MENMPLDVSRETMDRLHAFEALVLKWTAKINLISRKDVPNLWHRHILDSAQIFDLASPAEIWMDIGSGGGFPGLVVSIMALEKNPLQKTILVESDHRKSAFLRTCIRNLSLNAQVLTDRVESIPSQGADVMSARALADLSLLFEYAEGHLSPHGQCLFLKGKNWPSEHRIAQERWSYKHEAITSISDPAAAVLKIKELKRV